MLERQTWHRVSAVIAKYSGVAVEAIGPGQCLGETQTPNFYDTAGKATPLALDSFDRIEIGQALEEEFAIKISDDELDGPALDHVGGLVAFVQGKIDAKPKTYGEAFERSPAMQAVVAELAAAALANGHRPDAPGRPLPEGVTDLSAERQKREEQPDSEFRRVDDQGVEWFCFVVDFLVPQALGGGSWSFRIWARDFKDAQARVEAIKATATLGGQLYAEIHDGE